MLIHLQDALENGATTCLVRRMLIHLQDALENGATTCLVHRMLIHLQGALENGATTCLVRTVDTDVIVIIVGKLHYLREQHPAADVWIAFGTGRNFRYLHINAICNALGREKAIALPIFHSALLQLLPFWGKGRSQHGMHGKHSQRLQNYFFTWLVIHMFLSILNMRIQTSRVLLCYHI